MPQANTNGMQEHLAEISRQVGAGRHAILIMDQASWHTTEALQVPANISIVLLPPRSPELNPVEKVWQYLRQTYLSNRVFETYEQIVETCCHAWNMLMEMPETVTSISYRDWAAIT
jgi:transposase